MWCQIGGRSSKIQNIERKTNSCRASGPDNAEKRSLAHVCLDGGVNQAYLGEPGNVAECWAEGFFHAFKFTVLSKWIFYLPPKIPRVHPDEWIIAQIKNMWQSIISFLQYYGSVTDSKVKAGGHRIPPTGDHSWILNADKEIPGNPPLASFNTHTHTLLIYLQ